MHIFSTLFTAQSVDKDFRTEQGLREAAGWCREHGITKVYIESFRGLFIEEALLEQTRDFFLSEGFQAVGCVTTVEFPKSSTNYKLVGCYSHHPNLELLEQIFRRTAAVFDTIMIDDFLFTVCDCDECKIAAAGRGIEQYHSDVMHEASIKYILGPAKDVNPSCKLIIKYPNWYDEYYSRGYDVIRQTQAFDQIWIGNETREPDSELWGRYPQTMANFIMQWCAKLDSDKCMGGWYDAIATLPATYLEQARNTILGGARESMLFCYSLLHDEQEGKDDIAAFRAELKGLHELAYLIGGRKNVGVSIPKKPNCDVKKERYAAGMYGMLGIPFSADTEPDCNAKAVILGEQAIGFPSARTYFAKMLKEGKAVAVTEEFVAYTGIDAEGAAYVFRPGEDIWNLTAIPQDELDALRNRLLAPYGVRLFAKARVALSLYDDDMEILQNFSDEPVEVKLSLSGRNGKVRKIALVLSEGKQVGLRRSGKDYALNLPPRTLAALC